MSEFLDIESVITETLASLKREESDLEAQKNVYLELQQSVNDQIVKKAGCLVEIGGGLWAHKSKDELKSFARRRLSHFDKELIVLRQKVVSCNDRLNDLRKVKDYAVGIAGRDSANVNESFVEIEERLDDEGNVISAHINGDVFEHGDFENAKVVTSEGSNTGSIADEGHTSDNSELETLLKDMEVDDLKHQRAEKPAARPNEKISEHVTDKNAEVLPTSSEANVLEDAYELELIAGNLNDANSFEAEDETEPFDYDFESDFDVEGSDADTEDSGNDGVQFSLVPRNQKISDRFWKEVQAKRSLKLADETPELENQTKSVRFKDTLDIKEIENVSAELQQIEHKKQPVSKFKASKLTAKPHLTSASDLSNKIECDHTVEPSYHSKSNYSDEVTADIFERNTTLVENGLDTLGADSDFEMITTQRALEIKRKKGSVFRKMVSQNPSNVPKMSRSTANSRIIEPPVLSSGELSRAQQQSWSYMHDNTPSTDEKAINNEMHELINAYNSGKFDDEEVLSGPVVKELRDFEIINRMVESMGLKEQVTLKERDHDQDRDPHELPSELSSEEEDPIFVSDEILEREYSDSEPPLTGDEVEQAVFNREIYENYARLRRKLFGGDSTDPAITELSEENAGSRKLSKFKVSRTK